jgi:hypothetical protein
MTETSIITTALYFVSGLAAVLVALIVYIWKGFGESTKDALKLLTDRQDVSAKDIKNLEKYKVPRAEFDKNLDNFTGATREVQSLGLVLIGKVNDLVSEMHKTFAKNADCESKHVGLEDLIESLQKDINRLNTTSLDLASKVGTLLEWRAFKEGFEKGTGPHGKQ